MKTFHRWSVKLSVKIKSGQTKTINVVRQMQNSAFIFVPILSFSLLCAKNNARDPPREKLYHSFRYMYVAS
jgi:hypothetical protein